MSLKGTGKARKRMAPFLIDLGRSLAASGRVLRVERAMDGLAP
jgi:hypothetical protein